MAARRRGMILILSSPSGAGKTTLTRMLMQDKALDLTLSVSVTTRARRSSEVDGIHYRFIDRREFERMKAGGDLLEWAEVHGNGYGTPRAPVEEVLAEGATCCSTSTGRARGRCANGSATTSSAIFVLPPSMRELRARLERRAEDSSDDHRRAARQCAARDRALAQLPATSSSTTTCSAPTTTCCAIVRAERLRVPGSRRASSPSSRVWRGDDRRRATAEDLAEGRGPPSAGGAVSP